MNIQTTYWGLKTSFIPLSMLTKPFFVLCFFLMAIPMDAQQWIGPAELTIPIPQEAKPYTRWWWLGSAVDSTGLDYNLTSLAKAGIGGVEITPIYGVQGNDANDIPYLSPRWMRMLKYVEERGAALGIETNMATGTGWPFGGPLVTEDDAAKRIEFELPLSPDGSLGSPAREAGMAHIGLTKQKVKRAAPGGEGYVIDHFDHDAVAHYLARFDTAFVNQQVAFPRVMFNDSYEVYGADWTPKLYEEFEARRGYDLRPFTYILAKKDSIRTEADRRIVSDYRETLGDLLLENFTTQWTDWAHRHGAMTRNQAHGSPANLLDIYAAVDIPECEGFGLSDFGIRGLRRDVGFTKKNDSDISMLKYASSAAHISGKKYTSSETFTWLTEHFRTSLSQCKPDLDLMFVAGVNHIVFHGSCYSPDDAEWPGWRFYASVDMTPNNNWWSAMPAFSAYIQRCQSFLQWGEPDNDLLVYLPYYDMLFDQPGTVALFDIHSMDKRAPKFIEAVQTIIRSGYDVDYISDRYLMRLDSTSSYATVLVPDVRFMPAATLRRLMDIAAQGGQVVFVGSFPQSVPGYGKDEERRVFAELMTELQSRVTFHPEQAMATHWGKGSIITTPHYADGLQFTTALPEAMRTEQGLSCIRRKNLTGYHYFVSNLQGKDVDAYVALGVQPKSVVFYNPMNGQISQAKTDAKGRVHLQLKSGESIILRTFTQALTASIPPHRYLKSLNTAPRPLENWTLTFRDAAPVPIQKTYQIPGTAKAWTTLGDSILNTTMATGIYTATIRIPKEQWTPDMAYLLDLGDVRETAHVFVNGQDAGVLFAVPYQLDITSFLKPDTDNVLRIEVANLPANRIAQLDREGIVWRRFKEINVVDLNYKKTLYDRWDIVPSGLNSPVRLIPCKVE